MRTVAALLGAFFVLPAVALTLRAPWTRIGETLRDTATLEALRLSLVVSVLAAVVAAACGLPLAYVLTRLPRRVHRAVQPLVLLPMVLPPVVAGVGLLAAFGSRGVLGRFLPFQLPYTTAGAVLAAAFVAAPFFVTTVEAGFAALEPGYGDAARTLGAGKWRVLRTVTLPQLRPALAAGVALAWARALGEFGATITFAGNLQGRTQTLPLAVYLELQSDTGAATLLSIVLLAVSLGILVALRGRWLRTS